MTTATLERPDTILTPTTAEVLDEVATAVVDSINQTGELGGVPCTATRHKTTQQPEGVDERLARLIDFAQQLVDLQSRIDEQQQALAEAKEEAKQAGQVVTEIKDIIEQLEDEQRHLMGCIIWNQRGQRTFHFPKETTEEPTPATVADEGGAMLLTALQAYGLPARKLEQFQDSKYGDEVTTVGQLEALMTKTQGWYWKDVKGWGTKFATGDGFNDFPNIHWRFRQANPVPSADGPDTRWRRCSQCQELFRNRQRCPDCDHSCWVPVDDEAQAQLGNLPTDGTGATDGPV